MSKLYSIHNQSIPKIVRFVSLTIALAVCFASTITASYRFANPSRSFETKFIQQTDNNFEALFAEADQNKYVVRRVEFAGNGHIRDRKLRRLVIKEDATFTKAAMTKSLDNLRKLDLLKSARVGKVALDRENKFIDIVFEVEENEKPKKK